MWMVASLTTRRRILAGFMALALWAPASSGSAQSFGGFKDWRTSALADSFQAKPRLVCSALTSMTGYEFSITTATLVPPAQDVPEHCRVAGQILPEVRFEVNLPTVWNGRLYMFGNGDFGGQSFDRPSRVRARNTALKHGFVVVSTNTGHDAAVERLASFAANPQKFIDYAFRAVHVTVVTAKRIIQSYYKETVRRSYFNGCSNGGRQGLMSAQRFPEDFDGIVVGAPVLELSGTVIPGLWKQRALAASPIAHEKVKIIGDKVYAECDGIDGLADGVIDDPRRCSFNPATDLPRCAGDVDGPDCFTARQIETLERIYGPVISKGKPIFPGLPVGAEVPNPAGVTSDSDWGWDWMVPKTGRSEELTYAETFLKYMAFGKPDPNYDWTTFDFETDPEKMQSVRGVLDATDPDLSRFKARGGKIVMWFGWAVAELNPLTGVRYYESVTQRLGPSTTDFFRLYMVPGMFHCNGGVGVSTLDALTPLVQWVEKGTAPEFIIGSRVVDGKVDRTRPLCPYPQVAKYKGSGSIDDASSFVCSSVP